ncbi:radical SAM family heme chaperone HemW [Thiomicrospira sp. ALE5]|uniref:radical SAM family heme chaperone HemW n=1 Tax=Thiomicrospira sp. ALE5 TaxID=748650 RepID=UPI0008E9FD38|nr:radical SAM family heme chaperone HemW [Thiomicrospira sp. ALE5]SFR63800.1 oxygen-independent coproporphyrinogen-3 oxidase [Thiomicrospira sp. ALE5]
MDSLAHAPMTPADTWVFSPHIPLSLYIHYPWCVQKCPYCDFNSHQAKVAKTAETSTAEQERLYLDAVIAQLTASLPLIWGRPIQSIFFGGGTPSLMSAAGFSHLMTHVRQLLPLAAGCEITLEANPGTVDEAKFAAFHAAGVNRLSIGIQSFNPEHLQALGRIHDEQQAWSAIATAKAVGFERINLDLMYGLPNQTLAQALDDLGQALAADTGHLSHYQLTLEPNTPFYRQPPVLPDDDHCWEMQEACQSRLAAAGYQHYEVSAYAKAQQACQHNLNYWQFGDYLGLGAGAHGKLTFVNEQAIWRSQMPSSPGSYIREVNQAMQQGLAAQNPKQLGRWWQVEPDERLFEFMLNGLRLQQGFDVSLISERTGLVADHWEAQLNELAHQGWLTLSPADAAITARRLNLTEQGHRYLNSLLAQWV